MAVVKGQASPCCPGENWMAHQAPVWVALDIGTRWMAGLRLRVSRWRGNWPANARSYFQAHRPHTRRSIGLLGHGRPTQQVGSWPMAAVEDAGADDRVTIALLHQPGTTDSCTTVGIQSIEPPDTRPVRPVVWKGEPARVSPIPIGRHGINVYANPDRRVDHG